MSASNTMLERIRTRDAGTSECAFNDIGEYAQACRDRRALLTVIDEAVELLKEWGEPYTEADKHRQPYGDRIREFLQRRQLTGLRMTTSIEQIRQALLISGGTGGYHPTPTPECIEAARLEIEFVEERGGGADPLLWLPNNR